MREPIFKLLLQYLMQAIEATASVEFFAVAVEDLEKQKAKVLPTYTDFKSKVDDPKHLATLSIEEQQALGQNEINFKRLLREIDVAIEACVKQKWTHNTQKALWYLDDAKLFMEDILDSVYDLKEIGQTVKAKQLINPKKFQKADYVARIATIQTMLFTLREDILDEAVFGEYSVIGLEQIKFTLSSSIGKTIRMLQYELEDREINGPPDSYQFPVPEIVVPEVPKEASDPKEVKPVLEIVK